jgi:hypothetical protein
MQFEEDNIRPSDEDPEFTGGALSDDTDIDDEFLEDDLGIADDDLLADDEDDDESDLPTADL